MFLPVTHPGVEQKATWLHIRQNHPDYVLLWGWGVMNSDRHQVGGLGGKALFPASRKTSQGLQAPAPCPRKDYTLSEGEIRNKEFCHEVRTPKVPLPRGPRRDKRVRRTVKFTMLRAAAQHGAKPLISLHRQLACIAARRLCKERALAARGTPTASIAVRALPGLAVDHLLQHSDGLIQQLVG
jgi:hypothetical protein